MSRRRRRPVPALRGQGQTGTPTPPSSLAQRRRRHLLVVVLTFVTGSADATGFLALGGAFSSVMTGNIVLLGLSAGTATAALAITSGSAIGSYIVGVLIGAHVAGTPKPEDPTWPRPVTRALTLELGAIVCFLIIWELTLTDRTHQAQLGMLVIAAMALGIQSSAVQRFGVPGLSSTYLTGTLTVLIGGVAGRRPLPELLPSTQVLGALVTGAGVGALVVHHLPWLSPLLLLLPLLAVLIAARPLESTHPPSPT